MGNYDARIQKLEREFRGYQAPKPMHILRVIVDPDPAIGVVGALAVESDGNGSRKSRQFERAEGESVEDLERRVYEAMGWNDDQDPR